MSAAAAPAAPAAAASASASASSPASVPPKPATADGGAAAPTSALASLAVPVGLGTLAWGSTCIDQRLIRGGCLSRGTLAAIAAEAAGRGVTFWDTAEGYGGGTSETRLAAALPAASDDDADGGGGDSSAPPPVVLATKFLPTWWRFTKGSLLRAARGSCERMGVSTLPLYFVHTPVHYRSVEFWIDAMCDAVEAGLVREIGLSNFNAGQVERAVAAAAKRGQRIAANQIMLSLLDWNSPKLQATVRACHKHGVVVVAYSPIGQGLLTDGLTVEKHKTIRAARMTGLRYDDLTALRTTLSEIARTRERTMAQVALRWVTAHRAVPLVGVRSVEQARDVLGAFDPAWKGLSDDDVRRLDDAALARSTLESSRPRRAFFTSLFGTLLLVFRAVRFFSGR